MLELSLYFTSLLQKTLLLRNQETKTTTLPGIYPKNGMPQDYLVHNFTRFADALQEAEKNKSSLVRHTLTDIGEQYLQHLFGIDAFAWCSENFQTQMILKRLLLCAQKY